MEEHEPPCMVRAAALFLTDSTSDAYCCNLWCKCSQLHFKGNSGMGNGWSFHRSRYPFLLSVSVC